MRRCLLVLVLIPLSIACGSDDGPPDQGGTTSGGESSGSEASTSPGSASTAIDESSGSESSSIGGSGTDESSTGGGLMADFGRGEVFFFDTCGKAGCHGPDGQIGPAPGLVSAVPRWDDERLAGIIIGGVSGVGESPGMPGQNPTDQELVDVMLYLRTTFPGE